MDNEKRTRLVRARAPLRLGLAGGGTDLSPYCDNYGGYVLNATINLYVHSTLEMVDSSSVEFIAADLGQRDSFRIPDDCDIQNGLTLHRATYNRVMSTFNSGGQLPIRITTFCDAPPGSGLGSSSALVVSMLAAYKQLLNLPLSHYDIARLAFEIERIDCGLSGGKQDQYAAAFGGFNFMEFYEESKVIVNPLRIPRAVELELEMHTLLFFTGKSRESAAIIDDQIKSVSQGPSDAITSMHQLKAGALTMKEELLRGDVAAIGASLERAWYQKQQTSSVISNKRIKNLEAEVLEAGASSLKISGAGGGGFMMIFVKPERRQKVIKALEKQDGVIIPFQFVADGVRSWIP